VHGLHSAARQRNRNGTTVDNDVAMGKTGQQVNMRQWDNQQHQTMGQPYVIQDRSIIAK